MELYLLELLLIAEKGKIDEYVEYTKKNWCNVFGYQIPALRTSFVWSNTREGCDFWNDICNEAYELYKE